MTYIIRLLKIFLFPVIAMTALPIDILLCALFYIKTGKLMDPFTGLFFRIYKI